MTLSKKEKGFVGTILVLILIFWLLSLPRSPGMDQLGQIGIGTKWIYTIPVMEDFGFWSRINLLTVGVGAVIVLGLILFARSVGKKFSLIPDRRQSFVELLLEYLYNTVDDTVSRKEFVKPIFVISTTLFLFIAVANIISGIPGISVSVIDGRPVFSFFTDTWATPTADLNTNATYAVMVLLISYVFGIKAKGFKKWAKSFFEPIPLMFPMNLVGEISKPISHSLRLFGNIYGGGILVFILSYMVKYMLLPIGLWGFFGMFIGLIQALVFSMLAIAYISSQIE